MHAASLSETELRDTGGEWCLPAGKDAWKLAVACWPLQHSLTCVLPLPVVFSSLASSCPCLVLLPPLPTGASSPA